MNIHPNLIKDELDKRLSPEHQIELLQKSAISGEIVLDRGYKTIKDPKELKGLGFASWQCKPGLLVPIWDVRCKNGLHQLKPYSPRITNGRAIKYETPYKSRLIIDIPKSNFSALADPGQALFITEGAKKADALTSLGVCAIDLLGVWNWRGRTQFDGKTVLKDFEHIAWNGRQVYICFDNDVTLKKSVQLALQRFSAVIKGMDARVRVIYLPQNNGEKLGIDDWIASGNGIVELMTLTSNSKPVPDDDDKAKYTSDDLLEALSELGYDFAMNEMNNRLFVNDKPIEDPLQAAIRTDMRDSGFWGYLEATEDAYLAYGYEHSFHPIRDWLDSLEWDGEPHFESLVSHFQDTDSVFATWLKRWMLGAVAKIFKPGKAQNVMLVLDGQQGCGKSYFTRWLCSAIPEFFIENPLNPEDKDHKLMSIESYIWEVGELGSTMRKADRDALKYFISMQEATSRVPYGKYNMTKPVTCSLIGTINSEAGFLTDPTGNRRFIVAELEDIDWGYTEIDINQLWAEIVHLFKNGEKWTLSIKEQQKRDEINLRYRAESIVLDMFLEYFEYDTRGRTSFMSSSDIVQHLELNGLKGNQKYNAMELASLLKELGVRKDKKGNINGYYGVKRK